MTLFRDADPRFQGLNIKVGIFVLLGVIAGGALLFTQAAQQGYFSAKTTLHVEAPSGADLRPGMAVKLSGFKIGDVSRVALNERATVDLTLRVEDQYMHWIKADSQVSVAREGLIGDSYLTITSGNPQLESLKEGESPTFMMSPGFADLAQDLRNRILPVIDGTTTFFTYLNDPKGDFRLAMADLRRLTGELHETRKRVDTLLASADKVTREDVRKTLQTVDKEVAAISARTDASLTKLDAATTSAKQVADDAQKTIQSATVAIDGATPRLNRVLDNAGHAVQETRQLIDGAGKRWPFKGGHMPGDEEEAKSMVKDAEKGAP